MGQAERGGAVLTHRGQRQGGQQPRQSQAAQGPCAHAARGWHLPVGPHAGRGHSAVRRAQAQQQHGCLGAQHGQEARRPAARARLPERAELSEPAKGQCVDGGEKATGEAGQGIGARKGPHHEFGRGQRAGPSRGEAQQYQCVAEQGQQHNGPHGQADAPALEEMLAGLEGTCGREADASRAGPCGSALCPQPRLGLRCAGAEWTPGGPLPPAAGGGHRPRIQGADVGDTHTAHAEAAERGPPRGAASRSKGGTGRPGGVAKHRWGAGQADPQRERGGRLCFSGRCHPSGRRLHGHTQCPGVGRCWGQSTEGQAALGSARRVPPWAGRPGLFPLSLGAIIKPSCRFDSSLLCPWTPVQCAARRPAASGGFCASYFLNTFF